MTTRAERRRAAKNGTDLRVLPGVLPPSDLAQLKETMAPFVQRVTELQIELNTLQGSLKGMLMIFLKAKGYPVNLTLDWNTGALTPQPVAPPPDGMAEKVNG